MKIAILSAILGDFDTPFEPVKQETEHEVTFHCFTDKDFPPIAGLTPRMQYRIPKLFGWEMFPGYDLYIWLDGVVSFKRPDSVQWYVDQLGDADMAFFHHPYRHSIRSEVDHIEEHLQKEKPYITPRYKNGLHKEQYQEILKWEEYVDDKLWASTTFIYRDSDEVRQMMMDWWFNQSRYFTVDQIVLPFLLWKHKLNVVDFAEPIYKTGYMSLVGHHR